MISHGRQAVLLLAACFLFIAPSFLLAQSVTPFNTFNQNPVIQIHALPFIDTGRVLSSGKRRYRLVSDTANNFTRVSRSDESVLFDGETQRLTFSYAQGLKEDFEWGICVPYVSHDGGTLDHLIKAWHDLFGLPQQARDSRPRNQLVYRYTRNGISQLNLVDSVSGLGDVRLLGAWQWLRASAENEANLSLRAQLSLPTGDSDKLLGSGGTDIALWLSGDRKKSWFAYPGNQWGGLGVLMLGDGQVLETQQRRFVMFGSVGGGARLTPRVSLKLQLDFHSPLYKNSQLVAINAHSAQLILGGDVQLSKSAHLDLAVKEDPTVNASPDVVFHLGVTIEN